MKINTTASYVDGMDVGGQNVVLEIAGTDPSTGLDYGNLSDVEINEIAEFFRGFYADKFSLTGVTTQDIYATDNSRAVTVDV